MKETPIIFTAESIRAILEGPKTQTRRVIDFTKARFPVGEQSVGLGTQL